MKFLSTAVIIAFGTRDTSAADMGTNTTAATVRTFEIKEAEADVLSNDALGSCPECQISNFNGETFSFNQKGYSWTINNLGNNGGFMQQTRLDYDDDYYYDDYYYYVGPGSWLLGSYSSTSGQVASYLNGSSASGCPTNRRATFEIVLTSAPGQDGLLTAREPSICVYEIERKCYCAPSSAPSSIPSDVPSDIPSDIPSDQPSLLPSLMPSDVPSDIPSDVPSDQPSLLPSLMPSDVPSDIPSDVPSDQPSKLPSSEPSSEPSWLDDEQCKKKDLEDDICAELDGRCKLDCKDDEDFICVPGLCSYNRNWDKPTKSPKMHALVEEEVEVVDMEITSNGNIIERGLKASKAPKTTKAPKSSCACRVPRKNGCKN